jgi:hypothetical protein
MRSQQLLCSQDLSRLECTVISRPDFCTCLSTDDLIAITGNMCKQAVLDQLSQQLGRQVSISRFLRMEVGEGIQR